VLSYVFSNFIEKSMDGFASCSDNVSYHLKVNCDGLAILSVRVFTISSSCIVIFLCEFVYWFVLKYEIITIFVECAKIYGVDYFIQITLIFDVLDESSPNSLVLFLDFSFTVFGHGNFPVSSRWLQGLMFHFTKNVKVWFRAWSWTSSIKCRWPSGTLLI